MEQQDDAERWQFLRPWLEPLRDRTSVEWRVLGDVTYHALTVRGAVSSSETPDSGFDLVRSAFVLLAALRRVNPATLRHVLLHFCDGEDPGRLALAKKKAFGIGDLLFHINLDDFDLDVDVVNGFFGDRNDPEISQRLADAVAKVYALGNEQQELLLEPLDVSITMSVFDAESQNLTAKWWNAVKELASTHGGWRFPLLLPIPSNSSIPLDCGFKLRTVRLDVSGNLTTDSLTAIGDMVKSGRELVFEQLCIFPGVSGPLDVNDALRWGRLFETLVCAIAEDCGFVDQIQIGSELHRPALMGRWSSALAELSNAMTLVLNLDHDSTTPEARASSWKYLAYAFFSKHARSQLENLRLDDVVLKTTDVDVMAELLASPDPTNHLFGYRDEATAGDNSNASGDGDLVTGMLRKGTVATLLNMEQGDELTLIDESQATWTLNADIHCVKVLRDNGDKEFARVLIPGYGVNKVKRSQIRRGTYQAPRLGIETLRLNFAREDLGTSGLPRALKLIGTNLTKLYLEVPPGMDSTIPRALSPCVNLKALSFRGDAMDSMAFLNIYRENELNIQQLDCSFNDIVAFMSELSDMSTRIAQKLKRMACYFDNASAQWEQHGGLECVTSMLKKNRRLEVFQLPVSETMCEALGPILSRFDQEAIPVELERFPTACRLAFLSIFSTSNNSSRQERSTKIPKTDEEKPVISGLSDFPVDRLVFSKIFSFAGTCAHRHVLLTPIRFVLR